MMIDVPVVFLECHITTHHLTLSSRACQEFSTQYFEVLGKSIFNGKLIYAGFSNLSNSLTVPLFFQWEN